MNKKLKKVDFRMNDELYNKLEYIMHMTGSKRGSWCRQAVEQRVENFERDNHTTEEEYERFKTKHHNNRNNTED